MLLKYLIRRNENGVWFVMIDNLYVALPRWLWPYCEKEIKEPHGVNDEVSPG